MATAAVTDFVCMWNPFSRRDLQSNGSRCNCQAEQVSLLPIEEQC